jgi:hypothetical protein
MVGTLFGRRAIYHQVDKGLLNPAQFGRPGGECQDAYISKVLHNLVCHLTHMPMGQFKSNATACFDREIMQFVLTCYETTGAPLGPLKMWEKVLYNVIHRVKIGFGTSTGGYSFPTTHRSMDLWSRIPRGPGLMFHCHLHPYRRHGQVMTWPSIYRSNWLHEPPDLKEIVEMTRHDSQMWERLLWTSRGLLNLLKCAYYVLAWVFDDEGRARCAPKCDIPSVLLTSGNQPGTAPATQLQFDKTHKYLGNHLSTGMQMQDAYQDLSKKAPLFAARLLQSDLSKQDAWIEYFTVFVLSMTYSLQVSHHSKKKLRKLQSIPTRAVLMKLGLLQSKHSSPGGLWPIKVWRSRLT